MNGPMLWLRLRGRVGSSVAVCSRVAAAQPASGTAPAVGSLTARSGACVESQLLSLSRPLQTAAFQRHDHSKNIIGRDDGSAPRQADWWEQRPEIPDDAPEVKFTVVLASGKSKVELVGKVGESVEDVAKRNGYVEGACDGNCQCSTCHVFIPEQADRERLGMPDGVDDFEVDMLELAREYDKDPDGSRLSCQIILSEALEGLTVKLPGSTTNYMDHVPFD